MTDLRIRTGSTLLDLVVGGGLGMGYPIGKIINIVGDKSSGKTFLATDLIAANFHHYGKKLKFNYDDGEHGFTFDTKNLYGFEMLNKDTLRSAQIENLDTNTGLFLKKLKEDEIGIYVLDSLDGLSNEDTEERAKKRLKAAEKGEKFDDGTYGMGSAKFLSQEYFRTKAGAIDESNSLLIMISQVRENIGAGKFGKKHVRAGGKALDFYAHTCLWLYTVKKIIKQDKVVGVIIKCKTEKSKTPRPFRECEISVYFDYGIDNIGSNVDYLFDLRTKDERKLKASAEEICWNGHLVTLPNIKKFLRQKDTKLYEEARNTKKKETGKIELDLEWVLKWVKSKPELKNDFDKYFDESPMSRDELIKKIDNDPKLQKELEDRVIEKWESIEKSIKTDRKRKYL